MELAQDFHEFNPDFMIRMLDASIDIWHIDDFRDFRNRVSFYQAEKRHPGFLQIAHSHVLLRLDKVGAEDEKRRRLQEIYNMIRLVNEQMRREPSN